MAKYVVSQIIKDMIKKDISIKGARVLLLRATFKPNVRDIRNSKVEDIVKELKEYGCLVDIQDPMLEDMDEIFGCKNLSQSSLIENYDYKILAVKHELLRNMRDVDYSI